MSELHDTEVGDFLEPKRIKLDPVTAFNIRRYLNDEGSGSSNTASEPVTAFNIRRYLNEEGSGSSNTASNSTAEKEEVRKKKYTLKNMYEIYGEKLNFQLVDPSDDIIGTKSFKDTLKILVNFCFSHMPKDIKDIYESAVEFCAHIRTSAEYNREVMLDDWSMFFAEAASDSVVLQCGMPKASGDPRGCAVYRKLSTFYKHKIELEKNLLTGTKQHINHGEIEVHNDLVDFYVKLLTTLNLNILGNGNNMRSFHARKEKSEVVDLEDSIHYTVKTTLGSEKVTTKPDILVIPANRTRHPEIPFEVFVGGNVELSRTNSTPSPSQSSNHSGDSRCSRFSAGSPPFRSPREQPRPLPRGLLFEDKKLKSESYARDKLYGQMIHHLMYSIAKFAHYNKKQEIDTPNCYRSFGFFVYKNRFIPVELICKDAYALNVLHDSDVQTGKERVNTAKSYVIESREEHPPVYRVYDGYLDFCHPDTRAAIATFLSFYGTR